MPPTNMELRLYYLQVNSAQLKHPVVLLIFIPAAIPFVLGFGNIILGDLFSGSMFILGGLLFLLIIAVVFFFMVESQWDTEVKNVRAVRPDFTIEDLNPNTRTMIPTNLELEEAKRIFYASCNKCTWFMVMSDWKNNKATGEFKYPAGRSSPRLRFKVSMKEKKGRTKVLFETYQNDGFRYDYGMHVYLIPYFQRSLEVGKPQPDLLDIEKVKDGKIKPDYLNP